MLVIGSGERADHFHQQFGGGLLDFRALDLQDRRRRIGLALAVLAFVGDDAQLRQLERLQLDLAARRASRGSAGPRARGLPSDSTLEASSLMRRSRSLETPTRAMPVRSLPSRNLA